MHNPKVSSAHIRPLYDALLAAVGRLEAEHDDGARLSYVLELWVEGASLQEIGDALARPVSRSHASRLLNDAFRWVCAPEGGGFTQPEPVAER